MPERYRNRARSFGSVDPPPAPSGSVEATITDGVARIAFAPGRRITVTAKINGPLRVISHNADLSDGSDGLLGRDFLSFFRVNIDNARGVVELTPR